MENSNSVQLHIDLSTEQGKAILAAVFAAVVGNGAVVSPAKEVKAPKAATPEAKIVPMPSAPISAPITTSATVGLPHVPSVPSVPAVPSVPVAPSPSSVAAPSIPTAPAAPSAPKAPTAPAAPKATPKTPPAPKAPAVPFESLDEEGKREAIKKVTTKWSKKGKTSDIKSLFAAYGATNVETVDASYLDHFNWAINTFDTNGQDMAAVLGTFGAQ